MSESQVSIHAYRYTHEFYCLKYEEKQNPNNLTPQNPILMFFEFILSLKRPLAGASSLAKINLLKPYQLGTSSYQNLSIVKPLQNPKPKTSYRK